jgi:(2Fe-2S) ferredoxin
MQYKLHILVCNDSDCSAKGAQQTYDNLKQLVKDRSLKEIVKVSKSTCLDDCETGPNVLVYPQGIIYNNVKTENLKTILESHLEGRTASRVKHHKMLKR